MEIGGRNDINNRIEEAAADIRNLPRRIVSARDALRRRSDSCSGRGRTLRTSVAMYVQCADRPPPNEKMNSRRGILT
jgi:hypothetical protein